MMNRITVLALAGVAVAGIVGCSKEAQTYRIVPEPQKIEMGKGKFRISPKTVISFQDTALAEEAGFLADFILEETGLSIETEQRKALPGDISLGMDGSMDNPEGYVLKINSKGISITGGSDAGVFYGVQTLRKCLASTPSLPGVTITDWPAFAYRGAHFDVSRHFFTVEEVKTYIDMMALHNMNKLHWHLTEDQGWRLEIKRYPELTLKGSVRKETLTGHYSDKPHKFDGTPYGGFYTQEQVRDVVKYAAERHIEVIPEIDLPGHMQAALACYPELGCTGGPYEVWTIWGISDDVLCAGNPKIYEFLDNVLDEVMELFPSEYIHVGGDECPKVRWEKCPKCQALARKLGLTGSDGHTKEQKLQSYVMKHVTEHIMGKGRKVIGWDETLEGGAAPGSIIMSWRGEKGGIAAAKAGHDVIMTPNTYLYFDYCQSRDRDNEPLCIGGYLPVEKVYSYYPIPESLDPEEAKHIIGVQANLWTEYIATFSHAQYMVLPRWAALCEIQWKNSKDKDYARFLEDLMPMLSIYDRKGYNYAKHIFDVTSETESVTGSGKIKVSLSSAGNCEIRYTLDGKDPDKSSKLYSSPVEISESGEIRAAAFRGGEQGRVYSEKFEFSKATACPVQLVEKPDNNYTYKGAPVLTDGLRGSEVYSSGRWLGFLRNDVNLVVDLGKEQEISMAGLGLCISTGDGIFDTRKLTVAVSSDGENFREVASEEYPQLTESEKRLVEHVIGFNPVKAKFVRITASSEGEVPQWNSLAGTGAWLFIDEVIVN